MISRKIEFESCLSDLEQIYKLGKNDLILIRGHIGSGKSHFIRKVIWQFLESNRELKTKNITKPIIFSSYQTPVSFTAPFNAWKAIFKEIYSILKETSKPKVKTNRIYDGESYEIMCDRIGMLMFDSEAYSSSNYISEILETNINVHFDVSPKFAMDYVILPLPEIDNYFEQRKFEGLEKPILTFFFNMIKQYHTELNESQNLQNFLSYPLIFILEDANCIDEVDLILIFLIL